ncbi:hypothetical protein MMC17_004530 [Xylographa soralifera]|nr:hypothetical protein [Xylographa soralifera]
MSITLPAIVVPALIIPRDYLAYQCSGSLSSRRIIETSSYSTTPSHTPPVLGHRAKPALRTNPGTHRGGPTVEAILQANKALEVYLLTEARAHEHALRGASGNYERAVAKQALEQSRKGLKLAEVVRRGRSRERASEREMCCWSHEDLKRKRHLEWMDDRVAFTNCGYCLSEVVYAFGVGLADGERQFR